MSTTIEEDGFFGGLAGGGGGVCRGCNVEFCDEFWEV